MRSFFAISGGTVVAGGRSKCLHWAESYVEKYNKKIVLIATARGGEGVARIFAEYSLEGLRLLNCPQESSTKKLMLYVKKKN